LGPELRAQVEPHVRVAVLVLEPTANRGADGRGPAVVALAQAGSRAFLSAHRGAIEALLHRGIAVCLPDPRGADGAGGADGGRRSSRTQFSADLLLLGKPLLGRCLVDLLAVVHFLCSPQVGATRVAVQAGLSAFRRLNNLEQLNRPRARKSRV
jgi:hypothetical protein